MLWIEMQVALKLQLGAATYEADVPKLYHAIVEKSADLTVNVYRHHCHRQSVGF